MTEPNNNKQVELMELTADVISAYVANNFIPVAELVDLVAQVHGSLENLQTGIAQVEPENLKPAVPIRRSVTDDHIVCLEDGKKFKSLKRHLAANHGMTPEEYRARWNLPNDYPMVAPSYAATRSQIARAAGLGHKQAA